jgi:hypothetical protein
MRYIESGHDVDLGRLMGFPARAVRAFVDAARYRDDPHVSNPFVSVPDRLMLRWRVFRDRRVIRWELPRDEPFVYFPLHFQPEASTTVRGRAFIDQGALVEHLARSIPFSQRLYVKEHPASVGSRSWTFYRRMQRIPNVRLIAPQVVSHALSRAASMTVSVSGTAPWEAAVLGTPAVTLAPTLFDGLPGIARYDGNPEGLGRFIAEVLAGAHREGEYGLGEFLAAVHRSTFTLERAVFCMSPGSHSERDVDTLASALDAWLRRRRERGAAKPQAG